MATAASMSGDVPATVNWASANFLAIQKDEFLREEMKPHKRQYTGNNLMSDLAVV